MKKENKRIAYELIAIKNAGYRELGMMDNDNEYTRYHSYFYDYYNYLELQYWNAIGNPKLNLPKEKYEIDEWELLMSDMTTSLAEIDLNLTIEQKRALFELRKKPVFKKVMGETALQHKIELESILAGKITSEGMTFGDENGLYRATKTEQQLEQELNAYNGKLSELLSSGSITEEQYDTYSDNLFYIYEYYISISRGEQVQFRKMTNAQYEQVEQRASDNDIEFSEQLRKETEDLMYEHDELQELQGKGMKR